MLVASPKYALLVGLVLVCFIFIGMVAPSIFQKLP
jgi:hypothetical protein